VSDLAAVVAAYNATVDRLERLRLVLYRAMDADRDEWWNSPRGRREVAVCGTDSDYQKHRHSDDPPCPACCEAHARYRRQWKQYGRRAS
jgi:hypothetical protein